MGSLARPVAEAITWSGTAATVCAFAAFRGGPTLEPAALARSVGASEVRTYYMEDEDHVLGDLDVWEVDVDYASVPVDLEGHLASVLRRLVEAGGLVAWLGFEGSFDFEHVLAEDVSNQVYGVATDDWLRINLGDERWTDLTWASTVLRARAALRAAAAEGDDA